MARVVVLSFSDNAAADAFVEHTLEAQAAKHGGIPLSISAHVVAHSTIEAVVARPTVSCRCRIVGMTQYFREKGQRRRATGKFEDPQDRHEYSLAMGRWIKTERFGWLVHDKCKRPGFFIVHRFIENMLVGIGCNNLLPEIKDRLFKEETNADVTEGSGATDGNGPVSAGPSTAVADTVESAVPSEAVGQAGG